MKAAKPFDLSALTTDDLVARFTAAALAQYHASMDFDIKTINKAVGQLMAITAELKARPGDQRSALLQLYDHPNTRVRLSAARLSFALALVRARAVIQEIADSKKFSIALDAGMCLSAIDQGIFKPS
jgi:hypothetical protein